MWRDAIRSATLALVGIVAPLAAHAASVSGTVRDAATLEPVSGYPVTLHAINPDSIAISTVSGPGGAYAIDGAPGGNEIYVLYGPSTAVYANYYARLPEPDPSLVWDVLLDSLYVPPPGEDPPDSSTVSGRIMTNEGGTLVPVAGATVILIGGASYPAETNGDGRYSMTVPSDTYAAQVSAAGFEPVTDSGIEAGQGGASYNAVLEHATADVPPAGAAGLEIRAIRPNPLRAAGEVQYALAIGSQVTLTIHDLAGREVARLVSGWRPAGPHTAAFAAGRLVAGVYFCRLEAERGVAVRRFAIVP